MSIIATMALASEITAPDQKHTTAERIGRMIAAVAVVVGMLALYALTILGMQRLGPFASYTFTTNLTICAIIGGLDVLTLLGLAFRRCGFGEA